MNANTCSAPHLMKFELFLLLQLNQTLVVVFFIQFVFKRAFVISAGTATPMGFCGYYHLFFSFFNIASHFYKAGSINLVPRQEGLLSFRVFQVKTPYRKCRLLTMKLLENIIVSNSMFVLGELSCFQNMCTNEKSFMCHNVII